MTLVLRQPRICHSIELTTMVTTSQPLRRKSIDHVEREKHPKSRPVVRVDLQMTPEEWDEKMKEARKVRAAQDTHGGEG